MLQQQCNQVTEINWLVFTTRRSGFKPACLFATVVLELGEFRRLLEQPFWHRLPQPTSSRTSFLLEDQTRTRTTTLTRAWPVEHTQILRRARPLVNEKSRTGYQCRKSTLQLVLTSYSEPRHWARLLAASSDHSGDWLHVVPIATCGPAYILTTKLWKLPLVWSSACSASHILVGVVPLFTF